MTLAMAELSGLIEQVQEKTRALRDAEIEREKTNAAYTAAIERCLGAESALRAAWDDILKRVEAEA